MKEYPLDHCPECGEEIKTGTLRWNDGWEHKSREAHGQAGHHRIFLNYDKVGYSYGYVLGSVMGDGCYYIEPDDHEYAIVVSVKDEEFLTKIKEHVENIIPNREIKIREKKDSRFDYNYKQFKVGSKKYIRFLHKLNENIKEGKRNFNKNFKKGFIRGFFDAEGSIKFNNDSLTVSCATTDKKEMDIYEDFLEDFGFRLSTYSHVNNSENDTHVVDISQLKYVEKFENEIGITIKRKKERLEEFFEDKGDYNHMWSEEELKVLREKYPEKGADINVDHPKGSIYAKASELGVEYEGNA